MNVDFKTTVFLTSHDVGDIEKLCKRVIIINNGNMVMDSDINHLKYSFLNKKVVEIKTSERINIQNQEGINVAKHKDYSMKLEVDLQKKNIIDVIKLLDADKILDITVSNIPLEENYCYDL